jgi:SAM-dependent methyltransferase
VHAVDPSPAAIGWAERAARSAGLGGRVSLQEGHADDLPHTEAVFDLVIAMLLFDPATDPVEALQQASRVVRPMCSVVAAAPVWPGTPPTGVETMIGAIGVRPRFLTAWKQAAREAGLVEVTAETALPSRPWLSAGLVGIVARGWYAAGLEGARTVLSAPVRTFRHLVRTRALDLAVVRGVRWPTE